MELLRSRQDQYPLLLELLNADGIFDLPAPVTGIIVEVAERVWYATFKEG